MGGEGVGQGAGLDRAERGDAAGGQRRAQGRGDAELGKGISGRRTRRRRAGRGREHLRMTLRSVWSGAASARRRTDDLRREAGVRTNEVPGL